MRIIHLILFLFSLAIISLATYSIIKLDFLAPKKQLVTRNKIFTAESYRDFRMDHKDWKVLTSSGDSFHDLPFNEKYKLVFFGYSHCPDICPASIDTINRAYKFLGERADHFLGFFISVDFERDTPSLLRVFLEGSDPRIIGLGGDKDELKKIANKFNVFYNKNFAFGKNSEDYLIDHTSYFYLFDKHDNYVAHFAPSITPEELSNLLWQELEKSSNKVASK